ncbi:MAG: NAD(P)/FAD-dependent oxidoreductase [Promethearchaeia archaeon]
MAENEYDVIVVGAGPGGSVAAKIAAEKGLKTIFFERGRKPGEKNASGCGLGPRMWREFPEMMKELTPEKCPSLREGVYIRNYFVNEDDIVSAMVLSRPTESVTYEPAKSFTTMNCYRSEFDPWLAEFAVNAGAELKTSVLIVDLIKENGKIAGVIDEKGNKYKAPIIIGADGVLSTVAQKAGLRNKWFHDHVTMVAQYDFYVPRENIDKIMGEETLATWWCVNMPSAYQVFFGDGFHIGLGNWMHYWKKNPLYYLNRLINIKHFKHLINMLDAKPREIHGHLLPWMPYPENTYTDNVMLIGDAGGFPCPLEAEGVFPAMETGKIAAEVAAEAIAEGDCSKQKLKEYEKRWKNASVGIEFEAGYELWALWKALPFHESNMKWFIPLISEALAGLFDWSEPHKVRMRQIISYIKKNLPVAMPVMMQNVIPLLTKVLEDDMDKIMDPSILQELMKALPQLLQLMPKPKKKKRR